MKINTIRSIILLKSGFPSSKPSRFQEKKNLLHFPFVCNAFLMITSANNFIPPSKTILKSIFLEGRFQKLFFF